MLRNERLVAFGRDDERLANLQAVGAAHVVGLLDFIHVLRCAGTVDLFGNAAQGIAIDDFVGCIACCTRSRLLSRI